MFKHKLIWLLPVLAFCCGCGPAIYPASGTVVYEDDSPLTGGGAVVFEPPAGSPFRVRGEINEQGVFDLVTIDASGGRRTGAPPGEYRVYLLPGEAEYEGEGGQEPVAAFAEKYGDPARSGIVKTIKPEANDLKIQVEKPNGR